VKNSPVGPGNPLSSHAVQLVLSEDYFERGRQCGLYTRSHEMLEGEMDALTARLQRHLLELADSCQFRHDRLEHHGCDVAGTDASLEQRFKIAMGHALRDRSSLFEQIKLVGERRGLALEPVNRLRLGFRLGIRQAFDGDEVLGLGEPR